MPEEYNPEQDRVDRHAERNRLQQEQAVGHIRKIAREEVLKGWEEVGVDFAKYAARQEHARLLEYWRGRMARGEEIDRILAFADKMSKRDDEITEALKYIALIMRRREEGKSAGWKAVVTVSMTAIASAVATWLATLFARGH